MIYIPTLHTFENNNIFTGSDRKLRFRIAPQVVMSNSHDISHAESSILCELWYGPLCYELSEMEKTQTFPMSQEGYDALKTWLEEHASMQ